MLVLKVVIGIVVALVVYFYVVAPVVNEWVFRANCQARGGFVIVGGGSNTGLLFCG
jgi:hypothetical protein